MGGGGGVNSTQQLNKVRGVVLGRTNRGLGSGVYLRDVVMGEPINRKIPLHSPLVKKIDLLEENFVFKGRRKIKRAKLYYLKDRLPNGTYYLFYYIILYYILHACIPKTPSPHVSWYRHYT